MVTRSTVEAYFDRLKHKADWESLLAEDMTFTSYASPIKKLQGKGAFVSATQRFYASILSVEVGKLLVDGHNACVTTRYQLQTRGSAFQSDVAELFEVRDGKITSFGIYFDTAPFPK